MHSDIIMCQLLMYTVFGLIKRFDFIDLQRQIQALPSEGAGNVF
jgi:hypothetical protein